MASAAGTPLAKRGRMQPSQYHKLCPAFTYGDVVITREPLNRAAAEVVCATFGDVAMAPRSGDFGDRDVHSSISDVVRDFLDRAEIDGTLCSNENVGWIWMAFFLICMYVWQLLAAKGLLMR